MTAEPVRPDEAERQRQIDQLVSDLLARAGAGGFIFAVGSGEGVGTDFGGPVVAITVL